MTATAAATTAPASAPIEFNPLSPEFIRDPYPFYRRLRTAAPMFKTPFGPYLATRYEDVAAVLRDKRFGKDFEARIIKRHGAKVFDEPVYDSVRHWMLERDPPDHTRLRGLVVKAFTARTVEDMRPRIQAIVDATLDRVAPEGRMDVIRDFAYPLPVTVICEMLGIPDEDRDQFLSNPGVGGRLLDPVPLSPEELAIANAANVAQAAYFHGLFELRRREPGDDLITQLVQAEEEGNKLTEKELTANIMLLFGAGHETTVNLIGNGLLALHRNPDQLDLLKRDPSLMPNAIEELLRYDSSVQLTGRDRARGCRDRRRHDRKGRRHHVPARRRQPRSGNLPRSGPARHHPAGDPAALLRRRHPFLPGRAAGADRGRDRAQRAAGPPARSHARRPGEPGLAPDLRAARADRVAGALVASERSRQCVA